MRKTQEQTPATLTLVAQQPLPSVRAEAHGLQRRLGDARGSVTAGVALTGAELAQAAGVEWSALAEPVLAVAAGRHVTVH